MKFEKIWEIVKALLPKSRIGAWALGMAGAGLAALIGINNADLKKAYCESAPVDLPKAESVAPVLVIEAPKVEEPAK